MQTTRSARKIGLTASVLVAGVIVAGLAAQTTAGADTPGLFVTLKDKGFAPVVLTEGNEALFANLDSGEHQIVSRERSSGRPLFSSAILGVGEVGPVNGVAELDDRAEGYAFFCSLHDWMTGTLVVAGAPPTL